jgi:hypothetical protein
MYSKSAAFRRAAAMAQAKAKGTMNLNPNQSNPIGIGATSNNIASTASAANPTSNSTASQPIIPILTPTASSSSKSTKDYSARLLLHPKTFSSSEVLINPNKFVGLHAGDCIEIRAHGALSATEKDQIPSPHCLYYRVTEQDLVIKGTLELSLETRLADEFNLSRGELVRVRVIPIHLIAVSFIELSFKNQYIGRSDNWRVKEYLLGQSVYSFKQINFEGMRLRVDEVSLKYLNPSNNPAHGNIKQNFSAPLSGIITESTKFTFRSRSARIFILIQLSEEMWEFADDGELHFEKVLAFLRILFQQWEKSKVQHTISVIFFSRTYYTRSSGAQQSESNGAESTEHFQRDRSGRFYSDHYRVVIDSECGNVSSMQFDAILVLLKSHFNEYHTLLAWGTSLPSAFRGFPSSAIDGNILEAINCTISVYDKHFIDRDLTRTGQNIVLLSAGSGLYLVDQQLASLTKQRMVDGGIGCDLICMSRPPLHAVPMFCYRRELLQTHNQSNQFYTSQNNIAPSKVKPSLLHSALNSSFSSSTNQLSGSNPNLAGLGSAENIILGTHPEFYVPHWIAVFFYDYQDLFEVPFGGVLRNKFNQNLINSSNVMVITEPEIVKTSGNSENNAESSANSQFISLSSCRMFDFFQIRTTAVNSAQFGSSGANFGPELSLGGPKFHSISYPIFMQSDPILTGNSVNYNFHPLADTTNIFPIYSTQNHGNFVGKSVGFTTKFIVDQDLLSLYDEKVFQPVDHANLSVNVSKIVQKGGQSGGLSHSLSLGYRFPQKTLHHNRENSNMSSGSASFSTNLLSKSPPARGFSPLSHSPAADGELHALLAPNHPSSLRINAPNSPSMSESADYGPNSANSTNSATTSWFQHVNHPAYPPLILPSSNSSSSKTFQRRWAHLFATIDEFNSSLRPNWRALCRPAILPLTTDYFPSQAELIDKYYEYTYSLALVRNDNDYANSGKKLLNELICQRQAQDYQSIVATQIALEQRDTLLTHYLSLRNQVHRITLDLTTNQIDVKRYVHKRIINDLKLIKFHYNYHIYSDWTHSFQLIQRFHIEPSTDRLDWNYADNLLAGVNDKFKETLKYRRIRFALLPALAAGSSNNGAKYNEFQLENDPELYNLMEKQRSSESDLRLSNLSKFFTSALNLSLKDMKIKIKSAEQIEIEQDIINQYTYNRRSEETEENEEKSTENSEQERGDDSDNSENSPPGQQAAPAIDPLPLRDSIGFALRDIRTRQLKIPLYTAADNAVSATASSSSPANSVNPSSAEKNNLLSSGSSSSAPPAQPNSSKSARFEWLLFEYDLVYDSHAAFHIEIKWLAASGINIDNYIKNLMRKAERSGFQLIKIPTNQPLKSADAFHNNLFISLGDAALRQHAVNYAMEELQFMLDSVYQAPDSNGTVNNAALIDENDLNNAADGLDDAEIELNAADLPCVQLIHPSAICLLRCLNNGFVWVNNHLLTATGSVQRQTCIKLFQQFNQHIDNLKYMQNRVYELVEDSLAIVEAARDINFK